MIRGFAKKSFCLLFLLSVTLLLVACGGGSEAVAPAAQEQPTAAPTTTPAPTTVPTEPPASTATPAIATTVPVTTTTGVTDTAPVAENPALIRTFIIDPSQSEARYTLDEKLMGQPKTVVGATNLISGSLTLDPTNLAQALLSPIQIDARDFATDSGMRDNATRRFILQSNKDEFRYILFTPTAIEGLPPSGRAGDSISFQITGDLTISGVTKAVTFATTVTADSDTQLSGFAATQVLRSDFNLTIPNVPSVADVTDEVQLELQFVAIAQ